MKEHRIICEKYILSDPTANCNCWKCQEEAGIHTKANCIYKNEDCPICPRMNAIEENLESMNNQKPFNPQEL